MTSAANERDQDQYEYHGRDDSETIDELPVDETTWRNCSASPAATSVVTA
jgi:hypothetical protein